MVISELKMKITLNLFFQGPPRDSGVYIAVLIYQSGAL